ncbi:acyl-coenzyme A:6-aminopenicillanic acid acyl-transferase-domain-containing protein [Xylogone sp. PMI_703]|nr:acyl-coenzyme A:6-aminopenicillanic acid acyl-transferase-domain-containing protein [Xylogone sp. PMI_703]
MAIKQISCSGSSYEIGYTHGCEAAPEIGRSISFYSGLFMKHSKLAWPNVQELAKDFDELVKNKWPRYYQELQGIADGANRDLLDIIALNVRSEIVFGKFSDGCTSLYYQDANTTYMGQNWDWMEEQGHNLIQLTIIQKDLPTIKMVTEAGIIGKIGMNSAGLGLCFNAIRAKGLDKTRVPVHIGLRIVLESTSAQEAINKLEAVGMASAAHFLIGDATIAVGLEFTSSTFAKIPINEHGYIVHSNHMLLPHADIYEPHWLYDSPERINIMRRNISNAGPISWKTFSELFEDETGYPCAISRSQEGKSDFGTLFNIVINLREKMAEVRIGRPCRDKAGEKIVLQF